MTKLEKYIRDESDIVRTRADFTCEICGLPAPDGQRAHILKQNKANLNHFGPCFIHCSENVLWTHERCNSKADRGNNLYGREEHILHIVRYLDKHPDIPALTVYDPITGRKYKVKGML